MEQKARNGQRLKPLSGWRLTVIAGRPRTAIWDRECVVFSRQIKAQTNGKAAVYLL
jgi:hypothetical protein